MIVTFGEWLLARGSGLARVPGAAERRAESDAAVIEKRGQEIDRQMRRAETAERERDEARADAEALERSEAEFHRERDEARAEAERLRAAIREHREEAAYLHDGRDEHLWSVLDDLPAGNRVGPASKPSGGGNGESLAPDAPGGQDLNYLLGERDGQKWADAFMTVVPEADHDLMHTWFANAIETGYGLGREDGDAHAVEARTREIAEWVRAWNDLAARQAVSDAIESRFLSGGDDA